MNKANYKKLIIISGLFLLLYCLKVDSMAESDQDVFYYGAYTYKFNEDGSIRIVGYTGNEEVVNIPSMIEEYPVTGICGFGQYKSMTGYRNDKTKKIIIPDGVNVIWGFDNCINVEEVILPDSVTRIGQYDINLKKL